MTDAPIDVRLRETAQLLIDAALEYQASCGFGPDNPPPLIDDEYYTRQTLEQIKALMVAGWISPHERTLAVPNGVILTEEQWRALADHKSVEIILPGGERVLVLEAVASHSRPHFRRGSELHGKLWKHRERLSELQSSARVYGKTYETHTTTGYFAQAEEAVRLHNEALAREHVSVPMSFLHNLALLVRTLRQADDTAANLLITTLKSIDDVLSTHDIVIEFDETSHGDDDSVEKIV